MSLQSLWYRPFGRSLATLLLVPLMPISLLFLVLVIVRRYCYQRGILKAWRAPVPIIVVGNIAVGGTGKTPITAGLARLLTLHGWKPGIVSRGYGGEAGSEPVFVDQHSTAKQVGDEPLLLSRKTGLPVCVNRNRPLAVQHLIKNFAVNVVICDDGLQHYALARDIEVVAVDARRLCGNGFVLPTGPLREPVSRLESVDFVIHNAPVAVGYGSRRSISTLIRLDETVRLPISEFAGKSMYAIAGIANPASFFTMLRAQGLQLETHSLVDHHRFSEQDFKALTGKPIVMTEKDAVKCAALPIDLTNCWYAELDVQLDPAFETDLLHRLRSTA